MWRIELTAVNGSVAEGWLSALLESSCRNPSLHEQLNADDDMMTLSLI